MIMESMMLKSSAHQNPPTSKPPIKLSASNMINALITKRNNPKEIMVMGMVNITKSGLMNKFRSTKTKATNTAFK